MLAGLPATGKSTLARALELRLNAFTLDKDRVRETLFPGALTDYTREQDELCMRAMLDAATYLTENKRIDFILFDGRTFSRRQQIEEVLGAAQRAGAQWRILHLTSSASVAEERLLQRDVQHPARNRNLELYRSIEKRFEPITEAKFDVDTSLGVDAKLDSIASYLKNSIAQTLDR